MSYINDHTVTTPRKGTYKTLFTEYLKMTNLVQVSIDFVIDALQNRYDDVVGKWGCDASEALWEQALNLVEECGLGADITSPSIYVDNYLINGEFINKDDHNDWLDKTSFVDYCERHGLNDAEIEDLKQSAMFAEFWDEFCQDNALIYNDEYACLQF